MDNGIAYALNRVPDDALNPPLLSADKNEAGKIDIWVTGHYSTMKDEQTQQLSTALAAMKKDGSYQKIVDKFDLLKK